MTTDPTKPCCQHARHWHATGNASHCMAEHCDCQAWTDPTKPGRDAFVQYRRKQIAELRPYVVGECLAPYRVSISAADLEAGSPKPGDMIARNPKNHDDQWLVAAAYFVENFEPLDALTKPGREDEAAGLAREIAEALPHRCYRRDCHTCKANIAAIQPILARFLRERDAAKCQHLIERDEAWAALAVARSDYKRDVAYWMQAFEAAIKDKLAERALGVTARQELEQARDALEARVADGFLAEAALAAAIRAARIEAWQEAARAVCWRCAASEQVIFDEEMHWHDDGDPSGTGFTANTACQAFKIHALIVAAAPPRVAEPAEEK